MVTISRVCLIASWHRPLMFNYYNVNISFYYPTLNTLTIAVRFQKHFQDLCKSSKSWKSFVQASAWPHNGAFPWNHVTEIPVTACSFSNDWTSQKYSDKILTCPHQLFPLETFSTTFLSGQLGSAVWRRQEKGTRNSVFPRRVTLYLVGGKLRRRRSRTKEWPKTTKDQKAVMGEKQTEEY